jgi:hypothetical protein
MHTIKAISIANIIAAKWLELPIHYPKFSG